MTDADLSRPTRGEWTEIGRPIVAVDMGDGLAPPGASGLKSALIDALIDALLSRPTRGEWIEILLFDGDIHSAAVSPHPGRVD